MTAWVIAVSLLALFVFSAFATMWFVTECLVRLESDDDLDGDEYVMYEALETGDEWFRADAARRR